MVKVLQVLKLLIPIARILVAIFFPQVSKQLQDIWQAIETFVEEVCKELEAQEKTNKKIALFEKEVRKLFLKEKGIELTAAQVNLLREVTHARMINKLD